MKRKEKFTGSWFVLSHEIRIKGKWELEDLSEPDEWLIDFLPDGRYGELIRCLDESNKGIWSIDENGIVSIYFEPTKVINLCVFREEGRGTYLYFHDDLLHIPPDPAAIVKHHSHSRYRLIKNE